MVLATNGPRVVALSLVMFIGSPAPASVSAITPSTAGSCAQMLSALQPVIEASHVPPTKVSDTSPVIPSLPINELRPEQRKLYEGIDIRWSGWSGQKPSAELKQKWSASTIKSAASCFREAGRQTTVTIGSEISGAGAMVRVSEPIFDASGRQALVLVQDIGGGYGDRTALQLLARDGGHWKVIGERTILVS